MKTTVQPIPKGVKGDMTIPGGGSLQKFVYPGRRYASVVFYTKGRTSSELEVLG